MIKFFVDTTLNIVEDFDDLNDMITSEVQETFKAGELVQADIVSQNGDYVDLQFGDGSMAFNVFRHSFEIIED
jgi:exosome complex RNA-binding protein Csl4